MSAAGTLQAPATLQQSITNICDNNLCFDFCMYICSHKQAFWLQPSHYKVYRACRISFTCSYIVSLLMRDILCLLKTENVKICDTNALVLWSTNIGARKSGYVAIYSIFTDNRVLYIPTSPGPYLFWVPRESVPNLLSPPQFIQLMKLGGTSGLETNYSCTYKPIGHYISYCTIVLDYWCMRNWPKWLKCLEYTVGSTLYKRDPGNTLILRLIMSYIKKPRNFMFMWL